MRVVTSLEAADAIRRIPFSCWLGAGDDPNGFPNYPVHVDATAEGSLRQHRLEFGTFPVLSPVAQECQLPIAQPAPRHVPERALIPVRELRKGPVIARECRGDQQLGPRRGDAAEACILELVDSPGSVIDPDKGKKKQ